MQTPVVDVDDRPAEAPFTRWEEAGKHTFDMVNRLHNLGAVDQIGSGTDRPAEAFTRGTVAAVPGHPGLRSPGPGIEAAAVLDCGPAEMVMVSLPDPDFDPVANRRVNLPGGLPGGGGPDEERTGFSDSLADDRTPNADNQATDRDGSTLTTSHIQSRPWRTRCGPPPPRTR